MQITKIIRNKNNPNRFSIFLNDNYAFSISGKQLISSKIQKGDMLSKSKVRELSEESNNETIENQAVRYATQRLKSKWEIEQYLVKKKASPSLIKNIVNKLSKTGIIDDNAYAVSFIKYHMLFHPRSITKIKFELSKRHLNSDTIAKAIEQAGISDQDSIREILLKKRDKYSDQTKLLRYLASQGYHYQDIKEALN